MSPGPGVGREHRWGVMGVGSLVDEKRERGDLLSRSEEAGEGSLAGLGSGRGFMDETHRGEWGPSGHNFSL